MSKPQALQQPSQQPAKQPSQTQYQTQPQMHTKKLKLRQLFTLKSPQWMLAWGIGLATLFATVGLLSVSGWFISAAAIAGIVAAITTGASAISFDFFRPAALIRTFAITRTAGRYGERLASHHAVLGLLTDLRCFFFDAITKQKLSTMSNMVSSADTLQRLTHDIDQLDELPLRVWAPWFWAVVLQLMLLGFVAYFSMPLWHVVAVPLLLSGMVVPAVGILLGRQIAHQHTTLAETRRRDLLNPLTASTALILWQKWQHFQDQFHRSDADYNQLHERERLMGILLNAMQQILLAVVIILLIWQSYPLIQNNSLSVPMLLAYVLAVMGMYEILLPLGSTYTSVGFALASRDRLNELLLTTNTLRPRNPAPETPPLHRFPADGTLSLVAQRISAQFPTALTGVEHTDFHLQTGDVLFITGRSGAGKSTLLHTMAGELPLRSGSLTLNGIPLQSIDMTDHLGYLAQQLDIFDLTLAQNLRVGDLKASDAQLWDVLEKVKLADWARQQPQQLDTPLGEYGAAVSGGQARRISLARLLLKPRKLLLLDEPFAGLDAESAAHVFAALKAHQHKGILMIVSHHFIPEDVKTLMV